MAFLKRRKKEDCRGARSGYFALASGGVDNLSPDGPSMAKKTFLLLGGMLVIGGFLFAVFTGADSRWRRIEEERILLEAKKTNTDNPLQTAANMELPPGMLNPSAAWGEYFTLTAESETPHSDLAWNAFVSSTVKKMTRKDGKPSIVERVLPKDASVSTSMDAYTLYSYIREVNPRVDPETALIETCAMLYYSDVTNLPISLVVGVAQTESNFRPSAVSSASARGIMQVMWKYHWAVLQANGIKTEDQLHDPELGVVAGTIVLSRYLKAEQSIPGALSRYYGILSNQYVGITLSHKHAFELYSSGISESWKNSMARERHYWNRITGGREAVGKKAAPSLPGANGSMGSSVVVQVTPNPANKNLPSSSETAKKPLPSSVTPSSTPASKGRNSITVVYRNGEKATWKDYD